MNLRQMNNIQDRTEGTQHAHTVSVPNFANATSIVGNIGEDLDYSSQDDYIVDEVESSDSGEGELAESVEREGSAA